MLSAEPLVGLKQYGLATSDQTAVLSAEPLVGLKRPLFWANRLLAGAFSRTPRGFEALSVISWFQHRRKAFSRTPRGFEAMTRLVPAAALVFQPNPSWV